MSDLRRINLDGRTRIEPVDARRPVMQWVRVADLRIDETYQRPIVAKHGWSHIERIAKNFDWNLFVPVVVARLDEGLFALIDGQHRAHAAYLAGHDEVPCVVRDMSPREQAAAFVAINSNLTRMSAFNVFKAAVAAGEGWATEADRAVSEAGCRLMRSNSSSFQKKPREIYSIALVRRFVDQGRAQIITDCLSALAGSSFGDEPGTYNGFILKGFFEAVVGAEDGPFDLPAFCEATELVSVYEDAASRAKFGRESVGTLYRTALKARLSDFAVSFGAARQPAVQKVAPAPSAASSATTPRLTERQAAELIQCTKMSEVSDFAERHDMPIVRAQSYWHRVRGAA